ncbi:MAG: tetratricopeptide repeat protein, partial [Myxococcota bacterium]
MTSLILTLALGAAPLHEQETVVAVPFTTDSTEHVWVGSGIAHALNLRVYAQPGLNAMSLRQVRAAARNDGLDLATAHQPNVASALGRQLGADTMVVGAYRVDGTTVTVDLRVLQPGGGQLLFDGKVQGTLSDLVDLEQKIAMELAKSLGAKNPDVTRGAFGTLSVEAWREVTRGLGRASWQSLSPRNASSDQPRVLKADDLKAIEAHFRKATEIDEDYGEAWAGLGLVAALRDRYEEAQGHLNKATAVSGAHQPTAVLATYFLRLRQGRNADAVDVLQRALAIHPGFLHARGYLAELFVQLGELDKAVEAYGAYLAVAPRQ